MKISTFRSACPSLSGAAARVLPALLALGALLLGLGGGGCFVLGDPQPTATQQRVSTAELPAAERYKTRPPINTTDNRYEGSLWLGAASWGNLLRDHRARYTGDLLTVTEMGKIIKVPEALVEKPQAEQVAKEEEN
ncbi:MAG TPA: hypothetical protein VGC20_13795, partial [bacterium]